MLVKFWGTRGSIPVPGCRTVKYGGNTCCVEVDLKDSGRLILDAGTGIRKLGNQLLKENRLKVANLLLTHSHWDHIQGFPFFLPAYQKDFKIKIYGPPVYFARLQKMLKKQIELDYFPIDFSALSARIEFHEINPNPCLIAGAEVSYMLCNHPGGATSYKISQEGRTMVFMTDNELSSPHPASQWHQFVGFCRGADLLIHDAQYLTQELEKMRSWGHSSYAEAMALAQDAGVKRLVLFHHDPERSDEQIDEILKECIKKDSNLLCQAATEGDTIQL